MDSRAEVISVLYDLLWPEGGRDKSSILAEAFQALPPLLPNGLSDWPETPAAPLLHQGPALQARPL